MLGRISHVAASHLLYHFLQRALLDSGSAEVQRQTPNGEVTGSNPGEAAFNVVNTFNKKELWRSSIAIRAVYCPTQHTPTLLCRH